METIEITGASVEDAIEAGLKQLNAKPGDVMVEILEEPARGLFGLGSKEARVRLVMIGGRRNETEEEPELNIPTYDDDDDDEAGIPFSREVEDEEADEDALVSRKILYEILDHMEFDTHIAILRAEPMGNQEETHWILNVTGKNMRRLIGRRGDTLSSLQYIVRLIASRELERRANIIVDVDGYKAGRSERLRGLAKRMADRASEQGRTMTLEPMPPNERRIIHLTLRDRNDVTTRSVGDGKSRKVTIVPV